MVAVLWTVAMNFVMNDEEDDDVVSYFRFRRCLRPLSLGRVASMVAVGCRLSYFRYSVAAVMIFLSGCAAFSFDTV